jgi:hypothetical protein
MLNLSGQNIELFVKLLRLGRVCRGSKLGQPGQNRVTIACHGAECNCRAKLRYHLVCEGGRWVLKSSKIRSITASATGWPKVRLQQPPQPGMRGEPFQSNSSPMCEESMVTWMRCVTQLVAREICGKASGRLALASIRQTTTKKRRHKLTAPITLTTM